MFLTVSASASRRRGRRDSQQFFVAGDQISVFVQIADDQFGGLAHFAAQAQRAQLPGQMVGQIAGLGEKILERRALDVLHLAVLR